MKHVLVAGAAGFIGSHLVDALLAHGYSVLGIDNFITGSRDNLRHLEGHANFRFLELDLIHQLPPEEPTDLVFHLACPASPVAYLKYPFKTLYAGSDLTRNLLEYALGQNATFVTTSTSEVYGDPEQHPQSETYWGHVNPIGPRSVYDESKRYSEALCMAYHRYKSLPIRIARVFNTYGPRMALEDGRVIPAFASQALRNEPITVFGDGTQTRSFCFVEDTVRGLLALADSTLSTPCNIGNPNEMSIEEVARTIVGLTESQSKITFQPLPQDDPKRRRPDISLAKRELNWTPTVSFEEGLAQTLHYFRTVLSS